MNKFVPAVVAGMIGALVISEGTAWALKVWTPPERVTIAQLNSNFAEVANTGLRNDNLASNAAIAHTKLATPALVPKAWAVLSANCTGSATAGTACTVGDSSNVLSVTTNGATGEFRVNLGFSPQNANFLVLPSVKTATTAQCAVIATGTSAPHVILRCHDYAGAALDVNQFGVLILDT